MRTVIALGNPDNKHKNTRHNVGHIISDLLPNSNILKTSIHMNSSGIFIRENYPNLDYSNLLVIYDDTYTPLGRYKIKRVKTTSGTSHNGIKSIIKEINKDFYTLKIGIGLPPENTLSIEYVLSDFKDDELIIIKSLLLDIKNIVEDWYDNRSINMIQDKYNK